MKTIELTKGQVALVDDEDYETLNQYKWYVIRNHSGHFYAARSVTAGDKEHCLYMHDAIMNPPAGFEVDHVHREDTLDNRRSNLRNATHAQNCANRGTSSRNTSGFTGVSRNKKGYQAQICANGERHHLGTFPTAIEAAHVRDAKAIELHSEFASLNFALENPPLEKAA
jgi:hypothetical protein